MCSGLIILTSTTEVNNIIFDINILKWYKKIKKVKKNIIIFNII
jgi:hypothetical protein